MEMPLNLINSLQTHLNIYNKLKTKFNNKSKNIPRVLKAVYCYEIMRDIYNLGDKNIFLEKAYLLGFNKNLKDYKKPNGEYISLILQARDYINFLYCFDDQMQTLITLCNNNKIDISTYYKYINRIGS